jgi:hypothetical protein
MIPFFNPFKNKVVIKSTKNNPPVKMANELLLPPGNVVFETKKQYVNEYIKNQEKSRGINFPKKQEDEYRKQELKQMDGVVARYTTKSNPYMPPRTVFFTDYKITKSRLREMAEHEFRHYCTEPFEEDPK